MILAGVDVNTKGQNKNSKYSKVDEGVYDDSLAVGSEAAEFDSSRAPGNLKDKAWW